MAGFRIRLLRSTHEARTLDIAVSDVVADLIDAAGGACSPAVERWVLQQVKFDKAAADAEPTVELTVEHIDRLAEPAP
ncbi:hypothetical protein [uncultured Zoogloea sp.]|uniref:hypothetical protein n=1 Tax=uncultured Zoogloea sp. TaxID=160237 RepID=UPI0026093C68|nr:hypothetical protein [uncultured Zoogloea sp.]